ncbi:hypothetical protein [uncultured Sphingomonas sp.]|uniref:hypothetical protein n=1 Tax=uncultured Sphingomonas sp. TaxID=158754 RepID=UPI0025FD20F4|nr:hypothetical protein [uncultured Sphingomonas sp.]
MAAMRASPSSRSGSRLASWRLVAAVFLHFGIVAYLISVVPLSLLLAPGGSGVDGVLRLGLRFSAVFLMLFLTLGCIAVAGAAILDARARRQVRRATTPDAILSRQRLASATDSAALLDSGCQDRLEAIGARGWDHEDHRYQALARDLEIVVRTTATALAEAPPERRTAIQAQAADTLALIHQALGELTDERARIAARDADAAALYIRRRYEPADFTIKPD